jgi:hypothetical protein
MIIPDFDEEKKKSLVKPGPSTGVFGARWIPFALGDEDSKGVVEPGGKTMKDFVLEINLSGSAKLGARPGGCSSSSLAGMLPTFPSTC